MYTLDNLGTLRNSLEILVNTVGTLRNPLETLWNKGNS